MSNIESGTLSRPFESRHHHSGGNELLVALSEQTRAALQPHLLRYEIKKGAVLWDSGKTSTEIYFPHSGLISLGVPGKDGQCIEVASIGRESAAGVHACDAPTHARATVQIGGSFAAISAARFREIARENEEIAALSSVASNWMLLQAQLMAVCNASHSADGRFARWLLLAATRIGGQTITMTQEELAGMLGIRRTTATLIAQGLNNAGAIDYARGKIHIRDRGALESAACPCCDALGPAHWPAKRLPALNLAANGVARVNGEVG